MIFKLVNGVAARRSAIVKPKAKQTFRTYTTTTKTVTKNGKKVKTKTRKRTKIIIAGLSKADVGTTQRVLLTLQKTKSTTSKTKCRFYDAKRGLRLVSCAKPILITARLDQGQRDRRVDLRRADDAAAVARQLEGVGVRRRLDRRVRQLRRSKAASSASPSRSRRR